MSLPSVPSAAETPPEAAASFRNPNVDRFKIGENEAFSISDCNLPLREGLDSIQLYVNLLVLRSGKEVADFDAGFGKGNNPQMGWFLSGMASIGILPEQVTAAFLSHFHPNHFNGFILGGKPTFANAAFYLLPEGIEFWGGPSPDFSKSRRDPKPLPTMIRAVRTAFDILQPLMQPVKSGTTLFGGKVTIESAPGHISGHACFRMKSGNDELLHLMDLAHHHLLMFTDPDWTIAFDHDPVQSMATRKKCLAEAAAKNMRCMGFHLPWPGLGHIISDGTGYRWWAERWIWEA